MITALTTILNWKIELKFPFDFDFTYAYSPNTNAPASQVKGSFTCFHGSIRLNIKENQTKKTMGQSGQRPDFLWISTLLQVQSFAHLEE